MTEAKKYVCHKEVLARPMNRQEYNDLRGWGVPVDENPADEGYLVKYLDGGAANVPGFDGYISWSPKDVFERGYQEVLPTTFRQRVMAEHKALIENLDKLNAFIASPAFADAVDGGLLHQQANAMYIYAGVLTKRISNFGKETP